MTEDPREFGLTAADLRDAADRLYAPVDDRLGRLDWTHGMQARYGQIRSRLRGLADAVDLGDVTGDLGEHVGVLAAALERWAVRDDTTADAGARQAANVACDAIDRALAELYRLRAQLVTEVRVSDDASAARVDELLARNREAR